MVRALVPSPPEPHSPAVACPAAEHADAGRLLTAAAALVLLAAVPLLLWWNSEAHRLHARVATLSARHAEATANVRRLEAELLAALRQKDEFVALLGAKAQELDAVRRQRQEEPAPPGMPEGVRLLLRACNEALGRDGYPGMRFLFAAALQDRVLLRPELVDYDRKELTTTMWLPERLRATLDRARSVVRLQLEGGHCLRGGHKEPLPAEGRTLELHGIDGPAWERALPALLVVEGEYPKPEPPAPPESRLDVVTAAAWIGRLNQLLARADTTVRYQVSTLDALVQGTFHDVLVLGSIGKVLQEAAEARRLRVVVDDGAGTVELVLEEGVLRKAGGDTTIPASGYRILLPRVTPATAAADLLGLVERRSRAAADR